MRAGIDLESIWNAETVEDVMQLLGVDAQSVWSPTSMAMAL
jgi:hypothetical protein